MSLPSNVPYSVTVLLDLAESGLGKGCTISPIGSVRRGRMTGASSSGKTMPYVLFTGSERAWAEASEEAHQGATPGQVSGYVRVTERTASEELTVTDVLRAGLSYELRTTP